MTQRPGRDDATVDARAPSGGPPPRAPRLVWTDAHGAHALPIVDRVLVGAATRADAVVADPTVSRLHAEIEVRADGVWIRDLESTNGTFVEGIRVTGARLPPRARLQLGGASLTVEDAAAAGPVDLWPDDHFGPLVGTSAEMRRLFARLARVAKTDSSVLIHGETGTGKELVARAIHDASPRAGGPFVVVDCAAIPESLIESQLFGHARGAFTGAAATRVGDLEAADGGTVFLDEIGELPLTMQPKLLRALESRTVRRVGESTVRAIDVRFVSATHRDLRTMVNANAFREDLYFRLAVVPVTIPPLRSRAEDIPLLVRRFLPKGAAGALDPALAMELVRRPWLGNVRELRNFVERAVAVGPAEALALADAAEGAGRPERAADAEDAARYERPFKDFRERVLDEAEREYVRRLLARHGRNVTQAAAAAGVDRTYIYRLIRRHGL